jgi:hypothetical protein
MRVFPFYAVLLIAHLVNFRSASFTINRMVFSDQNAVIREPLSLHRCQYCRSIASSRGNQVCMLQEDTVVVTGRDADDLSILTGQLRDRNAIYGAVKNLLRDPSFLQKSNSLKLVTDALKRCATPSDQMLYFWKKTQSLGATVKKRDLKDLLYYCYDYGRRDTVTIQKAVETACELEKAKYWNSMLFNLIIQIYSDRLDAAYDNKKSGILLREIVRDTIENKEKVMDEKSLVMLLKYFGNTEDYESAKLVFSFRNNATKRPIEGESTEFEVDYGENAVVWNAYLTALTKIALKDNDSGENQFSVELIEMLTTMTDLKIADFYTHCIMLEYYAGKINANKRNNNKKRIDELVDKSLEIWNHSYFLNLRESNQPFKNLDDIDKGLKISYSIMIRCLLISADSANGQKSIISSKSDSDTAMVSSEKKNKIAADKYVKIALQLAFEVPSAEVTSSLLYSLGFAEENCEVAIKYMRVLIERSRTMSGGEGRSDSKNESEIKGEGYSEREGVDEGEHLSIKSVSADGENSTNGRNDAQDKYTAKKYIRNRTKKNIHNNGISKSVNIVESLLSGYYASTRNDLVVEAYLTAHDNLSKTPTNNRQFNALKISELNVAGSTKAFNLFLVSVKEMVKGGLIDERDKELLWKFCKRVIEERVSAENVRIKGYRNSEKRGSGRSGGYGVRREVKSSDGVTGTPGMPLFDAYSTVISMDLANMLTDYMMSKNLFYQHEASSPPSPRAVQTYLRAFQAPTQLYELDKLVNTVLDRSPRYRFMFSSYMDTKGDDTRTFDEMINAYLRVGNLPIALEYAAKYSTKFSDSAMKNLLIRFDRYWRDYDNITVYLGDLLRGKNLFTVFLSSFLPLFLLYTSLCSPFPALDLNLDSFFFIPCKAESIISFIILNMSHYFCMTHYSAFTTCIKFTLIK